MFFKIIINYILGYIRISIEGYFIERFINICKAKKIFLWNLNRENSSILHANISIKEFKEIKQIAKKTKCRIKIKGKRGIPFLLNKYKKRKIFLVMLFIIIISIIIMSNFVWNIEIKGNNEIPTEEILDILNKSGLTIGEFKGKIDTKKIVNEIRLNRSDLAWIGINIQGTNAIVEVVEADKKPEIIDENDYCNIVSEKEGVIVKVDAANGTSLVKPGDVVKKGTILVGGWMEGKYTGTRYVHAQAKISAKVWYTAREKVSFEETVDEKTGNEENKYGININNFQINFYKKLSNFENYDTISTSKKIKIFSDLYLPVSINKITTYETKKKEIKYSLEEAKQIATERAKKKLEETLGDEKNIANQTVNFYESEEAVEVEVTYEVLENIGTKEKIVF